MDDLIYILLLVAWVAYSFYNAKQKRKQKEQQQKPYVQPKPEAKPMPEAKPQRSIFEEIFKEAGLEDYEEHEPEYLEPAKETKIFSYEDPETWDEKDKHVLNTGLRISEESQPKEPETVLAGHTDTQKEVFDLRKAIIYNAILERPYH